MNRLRLFAMAALAALTLTACDEADRPVEPPPPPPPEGAISGTVTIDGTGVAGVTVTLSSGATLATGADGTFLFTSVGAGSHTATIGGYPADATFPNTTQVATIASDGQIVTLTFAGQYIRASSVVGTVLAEDAMMGMGMDADGQPVALDGVSVSLGGMHAMGETAVTVAGGFAFTGLRAGTYTVTISNFPSDVAFEGTTRQVEVGIGQVGAAVFAGTYIRASSISGTVTAEGEGLDGVEVALTGEFARGEMETTSNGGQFSFSQLRAGTYTVSLGNLPPGVMFSVTSQTVTVGMGQSQTGLVSFTQGSYVRNSSIAGLVATSRRMGRSEAGGDGDGIGGLADIRVSLSGEHAAGESQLTDGAGRFAFSGLRAGTYTVTLGNVPSDVRFEAMSADVAVGDGQTATVKAFENGTELFEEGTISGELYIDGNENMMYERTVDASLALAGATVTLESLGSGATSEDRTTTTDERGRYSFGGLDAGSYRVWLKPEEKVYKDRKVQVHGRESRRVNLGEGKAETADFPLVITTFDIGVKVSFGHDDRTNKSPAAGQAVALYTNPAGTGQVGKNATTNSAGMATFSLTRADVDRLAARTVVFSKVKRSATTKPHEDSVLTFTLDKNRFDNAPDDDHNMLWTQVTLTVGYVANGMPVPDADIGPFRLKTLLRLNAKTTITTRDSITPRGDTVRVADTVSTGLSRSIVPPRKKNATISYILRGNELVYDSTYFAVDSTVLNWTTAQVPAAGHFHKALAPNEFRITAVKDSLNLGSTTLPRVAVAGTRKVSLSGTVILGEGLGSQQVQATLPALLTKVDGSVGAVDMGDFTVSHPFPQVVGEVYHEYNNQPGYQGSLRGARRRGPTMRTPAVDDGGYDDLGQSGVGSARMTFRLHYAGANIPGDANGDYSDGYIDCLGLGSNPTRADTPVITCNAVPASASSWRLEAIVRVGTGAADTAFAYDASHSGARRHPNIVLLNNDDVTLHHPFVAASSMIDPGSDKMVVRAGGEESYGPFAFKFTNTGVIFFTIVRVGGGRGREGAWPRGVQGVSRVTIRAAPTAGNLGSELVKPVPVQTAAAAGQYDFNDLLEGPNEFAVVGATDGKVALFARAGGGLFSLRDDVRIVRFTGPGGNPTGAVPFGTFADTIQTVFRDGNNLNRKPAPTWEIEFRGTVSGYVFHNVDDDARVDPDEAVEGALVLARTGSATGTVVDSARTDRSGKYTLRLWDGHYFIDPVGETFPAHRGSYEIGGNWNSQNQYDFTGGGRALTVNSFAGSNSRDTDFFVLYNKGIIELDVSAGSMQNPYAAGDALVVQATLETCNPPANVLGGASGSTTDSPGTPGVTVNCDNARLPNAQTTNSLGKAVWENLKEGYYRISLNATTTKGDAGLTNERQIIVRVALPTDSPARTRVSLTPNLGNP